MRTVRTLVAAAAASTLGLVAAAATAQADPVTEELTVICDGIGDDTITVTGDLADGGTATLPADGPLKVVGKPGFAGRTMKGAKVEVEPTGEGVTCTAQTPTTGDLDEIVPAEQAATAPAAADSPVRGALTFTVTVDEASVNAAAQQRSMSTTTASNRFPFESELRTYLAGRPGATGVAVRIPGSGEVFSYTKTSNRNVTASIVKVEIMAGVMLKAQAAGRGLTTWEKSKIVPMIRNSDNAATTSLYTHIGRRDGLTRVSQRLGMTQTISDPADHWGLTSTVPEDQALLMEHFTRATGKLTSTNRSYGMTQMRNINTAQDWGVTAGPPSGTVALKNGWLPRTDGWHVNSIGAVQHSPYHYSIGVLTHDGSSSGTQSRQVSTIEGVSRIVYTKRQTMYEAIAKKKVTRVGGNDRFSISAGASAKTFPAGAPVAYVAAASATADILSAAPAAGRSGSPLLLVGRDAVNAPVAAELQRLKPAKIVLLGGTVAASTTLERALRQYATTGVVERWGGPTRYASSALISALTAAPGLDTAFVATEKNVTAAIAVAPVAGRLKAPVLFTPQERLHAETATELKRLAPRRVVLLGGGPSISAETEAQVRSALPGVRIERWTGSNRVNGAINIATKGGLMSSSTAWVVERNQLFQAMAVTSAAAKDQGPLYFTDSSSLTAATRTALVNQPLSTLSIGGGTGLVSSYTAFQLSQTVD
ncbi:cell wall-binding repeat-containing protein [Janibacter sp. YIM B02568]|uniref:cell wall-binding repeat-containing protein n=1 Tax=Janibacter endophyticus TaxID=2806261 RepID=UPI00194F79D8|nr:cell wall-binding repeat-containing protein [Janibacter endophyticus]MBM6544663.1 cell wall-binding repeat-containing protein [Janibacter endophyticus]